MSQDAEERNAELAQQELELKLRACDQLKIRLEACKREKHTIQQACSAGLEASKAQMAQMRAELKALRQARESVAAEAAEVSSSPPARHPVDQDEQRSLMQMRQLEARGLRHELAKWRHQATLLENKRPQEEMELANLKSELQHAHDVLESTRHAVRHLEVETAQATKHDAEAKPAGAPQLDKNGLPVGRGAGGKGNIDALAERHVRERQEERGTKLAGKAKRLGQVVLAQQLLIQRLEAQILKEEDVLERREQRLAGEMKLHLRLKVALRQRSDEIVVEKILGKQAAPLKSKRHGGYPGLIAEEAS
eukprot:TRINITY_DN12110_c0_g1_i1.p1 TRINITY_DN12110_c0_g1~~TRINITY_DN12110_c0_g1_i1.p1  ORF type:complete len:307 (-),score=92.97 TRINITY_DN12110_c0_g1_i1:188-1108(-)